MAYDKQTWADGPGGGTPLSAARLNKMEDGIFAALPRDEYVPGSAATVTPSSRTALANFYGNLALRDTQPVIVYVEGDSYSQSFGNTFWPDRLSAHLQATYPKLTGTSPAPTTDIATSRASRGTGVQIVNGATGGSTSNSWVGFDNNATVASIAALQPALYILMIGTNDVANNITPEQHKTNIQSFITYQKANNPRLSAFLIVHAFKRMDQYPNTWAAWEDYYRVEREIAAADPTRVVAVDLAPAFALIGVPGTDPLDVVDGDLLHPNSAGHALMADLIAAAIRPTVALSSAVEPSSTTPTPSTDTTAPTTPANLTVGTPTSTSVPLSWTASTDNVAVTGYRVRRGGTTVGSVGSSTVTNYTDTGLTAATSYSYTVSAIDAAGNESAQSAAVTATTAAAGGGGTPAPTGAPTDTFNRADSTAVIGTPSDNGPAYVTSGTWGISGNALYQSGAESSAYALRPIKNGDTVTAASVTTVLGANSAKNAALVLGTYTGGQFSGYVMFLGLGGNQDTQLWEVSNNTQFSSVTTSFGGLTVPYAVGDEVRMEYTAGGTVKAYRNGTLIGTGGDPTYTSFTHGGVLHYQANNTMRYDALSLTTP